MSAPDLTAAASAVDAAGPSSTPASRSSRRRIDRRQPGHRLRPRPCRGRGRDGPARCSTTATRATSRPASPARSWPTRWPTSRPRSSAARPQWGVDAGALDGARAFVATYRDPAFLADLADDRRAPATSTSDFEMVQDTFRRFADDKMQPARRARPPRRTPTSPRTIITGLAEMGGFGLSVPEEYGGFATGGESRLPRHGASRPRSCRGARSASAARSSPGPRSSTRALVKGGTEEQKQEWLPKLASAEVMAAVAVTEPDFGSDVAGIKVTATADGRRRLADQRREDVVHVRRPAPTC